MLQIGAGSGNSTSAVIGRAGGSGRVVQSGGSHTIAGTLTLGTGNGGRGVYPLDHGSLAVGSIARGSGGSALLVDGGTLAFGSGQSVDVETLTLGSRASRSGSLVVDAGTWTVDKATIGQAGSGTFEQTGGHFSAASVFIADGAGWAAGALHEASVSTLRIGNVDGRFSALTVSNSAWTIRGGTRRPKTGRWGAPTASASSGQ